MKKKIEKLFIIALLTITPVLLLAQPPYPNAGNNPGAGNVAVGGPLEAPVGGGLYILLAMAAGYGFMKFKMGRVHECKSLRG